MSNQDDPREDSLPAYNPVSTEMNGTPDATSGTNGAGTATATATGTGSVGLGLLEPSLKLDYSTIENNLHKSDQAFAREVVKLIAERAENGIFARDCWGYKFLDPPLESRPYLKTTGWDDLLGFNAYSYRKRLPKVAALAREDFKKRGIEVETLNIYVSERGIYCSWALCVPE